MIYRLTTKATKQYLFLLLQRDGRLSRQYDVGLDLGCNRMQNRPVFATRRYVGVDLDQAALEAGKRKYPEAETIHCSIDDHDKYPAGDFVVCVQVFSKHYSFDKAVPALIGVCDKVKKGGTLLINFGKKNMGELDAIRAVLRERFKTVDEVAYGISQKNSYLAPVVATLVYVLRLKPRTVQKHYFRCQGRI